MYSPEFSSYLLIIAAMAGFAGYLMVPAWVLAEIFPKSNAPGYWICGGWILGLAVIFYFLGYI